MMQMWTVWTETDMVLIVTAMVGMRAAAVSARIVRATDLDSDYTTGPTSVERIAFSAN